MKSLPGEVSSISGAQEAPERALVAYAARFPETSETLLARAVDVALRDPARARSAFWKAFVAAPYESWRPIQGRLAILEALEALLEHTRDPRYRDLIAEMAARHTRGKDAAFAYAFEARYTESKEQQPRSLACALYMDPHSRHLAQFSAAQKA